jgi:hypothetical protein
MIPITSDVPFALVDISQRELEDFTAVRSPGIIIPSFLLLLFMVFI